MHNNYSHISFQKRWNINNDIAYWLGECHSIILAISNTPISPASRRKLLSVSLVKGAQATTAIEGNTLNFEEIEKIKKGEHLPSSKEYLEIEVKNILDAFNVILKDTMTDAPKKLITSKLIKDFHLMVGKQLKKLPPKPAQIAPPP